MGRKSFYQKHNCTEVELLFKYRALGSVKKTAEYYSISTKTIRKYLHKAGVFPTRGVKTILSQDPAILDKGCLAQWLRQNLNVSLPHSYNAIASLTGCTKDEVKGYLYRKREAIRKWLLSLPDLRTLPLVFQSDLSIRVPSKGFAKYKYHLNKYDLSLKIIAWMKPLNRKVIITISVTALREHLRRS